MRELSVKIRFLSPSLGNEKNPRTGRFSFMRSPGPSGKILFLATWHAANMTLAAEMLGRHQQLVKQICWDIEVDAELRAKYLERCYYKKTAKGRDRWSTHESLVKGQTAVVNCVVPSGIDDTDFWALMQLAGKYKGLSPWQPGKYGHYEVVSIRARRQSQPIDEPEFRENKNTTR